MARATIGGTRVYLRVRGPPERLKPEVSVLPPQTLYDRPARCYDATMRRDLEPGLYGDRVEVCLDAESNLPLRMRTWERMGEQLQLVEVYGYADLKVNVGLEPTAFEPDAVGL